MQAHKKCFHEISKLSTFDERFDYLKLDGAVGKAIFGFDRYMNQVFYRSREWKRVRDIVIIRDEGCDLGIPGYGIRIKLLIHHMNPITLDDLERMNPAILDPEFLITTTESTHQAIHYGNRDSLFRELKVRSPGDTKLW